MIPGNIRYPSEFSHHLRSIIDNLRKLSAIVESSVGGFWKSLGSLRSYYGDDEDNVDQKMYFYFT